MLGGKKSEKLNPVPWEFRGLNSELPSTIGFLKPAKEKKRCSVSEGLRFQKVKDFLRLRSERKGSSAAVTVCFRA